MLGLLPSPEEIDESKSELENDVKKPDHLLKKYKIFIQDRGSGSRYLPIRSTILVQNKVLLCMTCIQFRIILYGNACLKLHVITSLVM